MIRMVANNVSDYVATDLIHNLWCQHAEKYDILFDSPHRFPGDLPCVFKHSDAIPNDDISLQFDDISNDPNENGDNNTNNNAITSNNYETFPLNPAPSPPSAGTAAAAGGESSNQKDQYQQTSRRPSLLSSIGSGTTTSRNLQLPKVPIEFAGLDQHGKPVYRRSTSRFLIDNNQTRKRDQNNTGQNNNNNNNKNSNSDNIA
jgi:hypothetical protein